MQRVVIELKLYRKGSLDALIAEGLTQTADYADKAGADEAHLVIFDRRPGIAWEDKIWQRSETVSRTPDGGSDAGARTIGVWGC
ncbi:hypothetical protein Ttaiw_01300 [Tepidimonas taiwanensis]|uniref:PD-(D/E)XK nuclease superfamily protein n=1 Tax=Tepidimonas taiwanensis TaxID=307486 RepID=A0A554X7S8_9BURK|nr:hypothetical protein Ttaiw_01300 [Tepidimonas taiwanensis]